MLLPWSLLLLLLLLGAPAAPSPDPVPEWQGECAPGGGTRSARRGWGSQGSGERANLGGERVYLVAAYLQCELALHPLPRRRILQASARGARRGGAWACRQFCSTPAAHEPSRAEEVRRRFKT